MGGNYYAAAEVELPMGAVPVHEAFVALSLDAGLRYSSFYATFAYASSYYAPTELFGCTFAGLSGPLDVDTFTALRAEACTLLGTGYAYPEGSPGSFTHLVAFAEELAVDEPFGRHVPRVLTLTAYATIACAQAGQALSHTATASARRAPGGDRLEVEPATYDQAITDVSYLSAYGPYFTTSDMAESIISVNRGQSFHLRMDLTNNTLLRDPSAVVTIPPGVTLVDVLWVDDAYYGYTESTCESPVVTVDEHHYSDGSKTLALDLGSGGAGPWYFVQSCDTSDCEPSGNGSPVLVLYVEPTHPWRDGDVAAFEATWSATNSPYPSTLSGGITINVPSQARASPSSRCARARARATAARERRVGRASP